MSIRYRKVQNKIEGSKTFQQWYGRAVVLDTVSTKQLAEELSHSTTVTRADIMAVFTELSVALKNHLLNSQRVVLDGIGSFRPSIKCKSVVKKEDFGANQITGYRIIYQPETFFTPTGVNAKGKRVGFRTKFLLQGATAQEMPEGKTATPAESAGK